jgi:hypothetical protein
MLFPQALREKYKEKVDASSEHLTPTMPDFKIPVLDDALLLQVGVAKPSGFFGLVFMRRVYDDSQFDGAPPHYILMQREIAAARAVKAFRQEREILKSLRAEESRKREQTKVPSDIHLFFSVSFPWSSVLGLSWRAAPCANLSFLPNSGEPPHERCGLAQGSGRKAARVRHLA